MLHKTKFNILNYKNNETFFLRKTLFNLQFYKVKSTNFCFSYM